MPYTDPEQRKAYQREWRRQRRLAAIDYLGGKCSSCGTSDNLEFDHEDRSVKTFNVNYLLSRKWSVQQQELDKCQLLCVDCHKGKTVTVDLPQWNGVAEHGTHSKYTSGCRCRLCKDAHAESTTEWKSRQSNGRLTE